MLKVVVVILVIFNLLACNPLPQASQKTGAQPPIPFSCLASQSSCEVNTDVGTFMIEFSAKVDTGRLTTELPFQIQLTFSALSKSSQLKNVTAYLEGTTMFMGKIPVFFQHTDNRTDVVVAQSLLASCSAEVMAWRLWFTVEIENNDKITTQNFFIDFDSQRL